MQLSIIIVSYNTKKLTLQTVRSLQQAIGQDSPLADNWEMIVVDNDSHDRTVEALEKLGRQNLKIIRAGENLGFGRANNLGFKRATGQLILFLNSDTIVPAGTLEKMTAYYLNERERVWKKRKLGLLAAGLRNADGTIQPQGGDLPSLGTIGSAMFFVDDLPVLNRFLPSVQHTGRRFNAQKAVSVEFERKGWVAGTAVMIHRDLITDFGGWDENIFMYGEDQEWSYRLHQKGFYHGILQTAPITHLGSASGGSAFALVGEVKGYLYFFQKYKSREQWDWLKLILWLAMFTREFVFGVLKKDSKRADAYSQALSVVEEARYD